MAPRPRASLRRRVLRTLALLFSLALAAWLAAAWTLRGPVGGASPKRETTPASVERVRTDVEHLCRVLAPRDALHPERSAATAAWIAASWRESGLEVELQGYEIGGVEHANVLARRRGREPGLGLLVLGAHHDAYRTTPGADDNASGVAALLELARTTRGRTLRHDLLLVAFDTEEPPHFGSDRMGSAVLAEELLRRGEPVVAMAALDMVGRYSDEPGSQAWPLGWMGLVLPERGDFLAVAGDWEMSARLAEARRGLRSARSLPILSLRAPAGFGWTDLSDHSSFRKRGLPGLLITDTGPLRNPDYHGAGDLPERLDHERLAAVVPALEALLLEWDEP